VYGIEYMMEAELGI